jgi:hypothetical protein
MSKWSLKRTAQYSKKDHDLLPSKKQAWQVEPTIPVLLPSTIQMPQPVVTQSKAFKWLGHPMWTQIALGARSFPICTWHFGYCVEREVPDIKVSNGESMLPSNEQESNCFPVHHQPTQPTLPTSRWRSSSFGITSGDTRIHSNVKWYWASLETLKWLKSSNRGTNRPRHARTHFVQHVNLANKARPVLKPPHKSFSLIAKT